MGKLPMGEVEAKSRRTLNYSVPSIRVASSDFPPVHLTISSFFLKTLDKDSQIS